MVDVGLPIWRSLSRMGFHDIPSIRDTALVNRLPHFQTQHAGW